MAVVGGGSTYTPELIDGFARFNAEVTELSLPPVAGAVLAGLDALGASPGAKATLRAVL